MPQIYSGNVPGDTATDASKNTRKLWPQHLRIRMVDGANFPINGGDLNIRWSCHKTFLYLAVVRTGRDRLSSCIYLVHRLLALVISSMCFACPIPTGYRTACPSILGRQNGRSQSSHNTLSRQRYYVDCYCHIYIRRSLDYGRVWIPHRYENFRLCHSRIVSHWVCILVP